MDKSIEMVFDSKGYLIHMPKKTEKRKKVLRYVMTLFDSKKDYTEKEVTDMLKMIFDDPIYLRRLLIEEQLLQRKKDGSKYWVNIDENQTQY